MNEQLKRRQSFPLRLSTSIRQKANDLAHEDGLSLNHFISLAIAEKLTRVEQSRLFQQGQPKRASSLGSNFRH